MSEAYSINGEDFNHSSIEGAVEELWDLGETHAGDEATIFEGIVVEYKASSFAPAMAEWLEQNALDAVGDNALHWDLGDAGGPSIQEAVEQAIDKWADENGMQPPFFGAGRVRPIKIRFIDSDGDFDFVIPDRKDKANQPKP